MLKTWQNYRGGAGQVVIPVSAVPLRIFVFLTTSRLPSRRRAWSSRNGKHDVNGTGGTPKTAFYRHEKSYVALLKIEGKTVRGSKP
jgi:hypothetical protein